MINSVAILLISCVGRWDVQDGAYFVCRFEYSSRNRLNVYSKLTVICTIWRLVLVAVYWPSVQMLAPRRLYQSLVPLIGVKSSLFLIHRQLINLLYIFVNISSQSVFFCFVLSIVISQLLQSRHTINTSTN